MIVQGNSFRLPLADNSVHCAISSYPYFNLRTYDLPPLIIGGLENCRHQWEFITQKRGNGGERDYGSYDGGVGRGPAVSMPESAVCSLCSAFYGSFGLEPSISLHVRNAVLVSREVKRVLRPDGVFWLNYGDSFSTARNGRSAADGKALGSDDRTFRDKPFTVDEIPAKNLCLIPERIVIALQDDGWIVRSIAPWVKSCPMPESVADRPGTAHEYIFMLTKNPRYFFDMDGVRRGYNSLGTPRPFAHNGNGDRNDTGRVYEATDNGGRALRTSDFFFDSLDAYIAHLQDIRDNGGLMLEADGSPAAFVVNPKGYKYAHYATYPIDLITPMIKCSTSERGCCRDCGAPWMRETEKTSSHSRLGGNDWQNGRAGVNHHGPSRPGSFIGGESKTLGWRPSCSCYRTRNQTKRRRQDALQDYYDFLMDVTKDEQESDGVRAIAFVQASRFWPYLWSSRVAKNHTAPTIPAIVLDPFVGSGTTVLAAQQLGRRGIGVDLNPTYLLENALPRTAKKGGRSLEELPLFALQEALNV